MIPYLFCYSIHSLRESTHKRLQVLATEKYRLSDVMRESLSRDQIAPVVLEAHLEALDRRLKLILEQVAKCISRKGDEAEVLKPEPKLEDYKDPDWDDIDSQR